MEDLPDDIHEYIISFLSGLEDLITIPRVNKQFQTIASRYRHPLIVNDTECTEAKWISVMHSISNIYRNIDEIHFKRCNITEQALSGLLMRCMKSINLRECRYVTNHLNWLNNVVPLKCTTLTLAKCSKLPDFTQILVSNANTTFHGLQCLLLDRQTFKATHCNVFAKRFPQLETLAIINSTLYSVPLTFLTQLKRLKHLFLGGSQIFDSALKHLLFNVNAIFNVMEIVEMRLNKEEGAYDDYGYDEHVIQRMNILQISNHNPLASDAKMHILIHALSSVFRIIQQLLKNGVKWIEMSFYKPYNIQLSTLYHHREQNYIDVHFDGLSVARLIFTHLLHKYYGSEVNILDFSKYPSAYGGLKCLCTTYTDIRMAIEYVVDLATDDFGQTALHIACTDGATVYVDELIYCGVYCDTRDGRGGTALFQASVHNHHEIVNLLVNNGADIFKRKTTKETPMEIACMRSNVEIIKIMLEAAPVAHFNDNTKYDNGWSPLHCCCLSGNTQTLNLLINNGLYYAAQNIWKESPLHICAVKNYVDCASILINKYNLKELLLRDEFNKTAEQIAAANNNYDVVKLIRYRKYELMRQNNTHEHRYTQRYGAQQQRYSQNHSYRSRANRSGQRGRGRGRGRHMRRARGTRSAKPGYYYRPKAK